VQQGISQWLLAALCNCRTSIRNTTPASQEAASSVVSGSLEETQKHTPERQHTHKKDW
jgi:hypothetical protein